MFRWRRDGDSLEIFRDFLFRATCSIVGLCSSLHAAAPITTNPVKAMGVKIQALYGGSSLTTSTSTWALKKSLKASPPGCIVSTPSRLTDFVRSKCVDMTTLTMVVLDEADKLCGKQFLPETEAIVKRVPPASLLAFFSATYGQHSRRIIRGWAAGFLGHLVEFDVGNVGYSTGESEGRGG